MAGINTVMYYSATIIQLAGVEGESLIIWLAACVAFVNFACTIIGLILIEKTGRRKLALWSMVGTLVSLILLGLSFQISAIYSPEVNYIENIANAENSGCSDFNTCWHCERSSCGYCYSTFHDRLIASCLPVNATDNNFALDGRCEIGRGKDVKWATETCPSEYAWMSLVGLVLYLIFFASGMGAIPWIVNSEIYPTWARSRANALSTCVNWIFNLIISLTFLSLTDAITKFGAFYLYAGMAFCGCLFIYFLLPETKGKSLDEMEELFLM